MFFSRERRIMEILLGLREFNLYIYYFLEMDCKVLLKKWAHFLLQPVYFFFAPLIVSCTVQTEFINEPAIIVPARLSVTPDPVVLEIGEELTLAPKFFDSLGLPDTNVLFNWISLDPNLFSVDEGGKVRGNKAGMGTLAVEVLYSQSVTALGDTLAVFVSETASSFTFSITDPGDSLTMMSVGDLLELKSVTEQIPDLLLSRLKWVSTDTSVLKVSGSGTVTAIGPGKAVVLLELDSVLSNPVNFTISQNIRTGTFIPRPGSSYHVEGEVSIFIDDQGELQVMFRESFKTSSGPGLGVYLSPTEQVTSASLRLGALQSVTGNQTYNVPSGSGINDFDWIIIHCEPFDVSFGYAQLN